MFDKSRRNINTGGLRRLIYLIDMGAGRVSQEVIDKWEKELIRECSRISEEYGL